MELQNNPFLRLLRAGLWNLPLEESLEPISEADWIEILAQARAHSVLALIADGAAKVTETSRPSLQQIASLALATEEVERGNRKVDAVLRKMAAFWQKEGVETILLKGQGLARLYVIPEHRTPGDIDWYLPGKENYNKALSLVQSKGFIPVSDSDGDYHYSVSGVVVEHHKKWCDLSSPFKRRRIAEIENEFGYSQGSYFTVPAPLTNLVQLNIHILKHLLVRGVGWRQLCDLALATKHYQGQYSQEEFRNAVKSLGLTRWTKLLFGVLAKYLGVDPACLPVDPMAGKDVDWLGEMIMSCGNFGRESGKGMLSSYVSSALLLCRYTPGEVFWRPVMLELNRLGRLFNRK